MKSEKEIEHYLCHRVAEIGGRALKFVSPGRAGVPDRLVLLPGGIIWFVELKAPGMHLRPIQRQAHRLLVSLGARVTTLDSQQAVEDFIREVGHGV